MHELTTKRMMIWLGLSLTPLLMASCSQQETEVVTEERVVAVKAMIVQPSDRLITSNFTGALQGEQQAVVRARLAEAVTDVKVEEGQRVVADEVLLILDKYGPSSQYAQTYSTYMNASKNLEKMQFLFNEGAVAETAFDAARTEYEVIKAQFSAITRMIEVQTPISGTVTSVAVSPGDLVGIGQELVTVATTETLRIKFGVNAEEIPFFKIGAEVIVSSEAVAANATGRIVAIASSADPITRSFQVEALIDNKTGDYSPGMFVHVAYILDRLSQVLAVPHHAVLNLDGQSTVFAVSNGRAQSRTVTLGTNLSGDVVVTSGLAIGDTLVTLGQDYLEDSVKLHVTELQEPTR